MSRRRARAGEESLGDEVVGLLVEIARLRPAVGLGIAAASLAVGAWLFWGDGRRWGGTGPIVGIVGILLGCVVAVSAAVSLIGVKLRGTGGEVEDSAIAERQRCDGREFERNVAERFRAMGYEVEETGTHGKGGDRGVDLILRRVDQAEAVCVQCKDYAAWKVGVEPVRAFAGAVALRGAGHVGWIVTSGRFTADAVRDARELGIRLIDGEEWEEMRGLGGGGAASVGAVEAKAAPRGAEAPICSRCRVAMVRREPRAGGKVFRPFWGCANYPHCKEKVEIRDRLGGGV